MVDILESPALHGVLSYILVHYISISRTLRVMNDPFPHLLIGDQILDGWRGHQPDIWPTNKKHKLWFFFPGGRYTKTTQRLVGNVGQILDVVGSDRFGVWYLKYSSNGLRSNAILQCLQLPHPATMRSRRVIYNQNRIHFLVILVVVANELKAFKAYHLKIKI